MEIEEVAEDSVSVGTYGRKKFRMSSKNPASLAGKSRRADAKEGATALPMAPPTIPATTISESVSLPNLIPSTTTAMALRAKDGC